VNRAATLSNNRTNKETTAAFAEIYSSQATVPATRWREMLPTGFEPAPFMLGVLWL